VFWAAVRFLLCLPAAALLLPLAGQCQIDPVSRSLVQLGYNGSFEGRAPLAAYAFYYRNIPDFPRTNLTLRLAVAPVYMDSELGIRHALGENTDLGIGMAGGGFADSYEEIHRGKFYPDQSFNGHGGELSLSVYHLFNPGSQIPLYGLVRGIAHYSVYDETSDTAPGFALPEDHGSFSLRTGLRWGGREPTLHPDLAMELSIWYEGTFRTSDDPYGFIHDRTLEPRAHLFWSEAFLAYTLPKSGQSFSVSLTLGTSVEPDRLSAYRLGGLLPMASEFPLSLPGYYYQEISAQRFLLLGGAYSLPLDPGQHWNLTATANTALVDYLDGLEQPGHWHSGVGGGLLYKSPTWKVMAGYAYGFDAIRSQGRGASSIGIWLQLDLDRATSNFKSAQPGKWRGFQRVLSAIKG
jgi:hypothetical protein